MCDLKGTFWGRYISCSRSQRVAALVLQSETRTKELWLWDELACLWNTEWIRNVYSSYKLRFYRKLHCNKQMLSEHHTFPPFPCCESICGQYIGGFIFYIQNQKKANNKRQCQYEWILSQSRMKVNVVKWYRKSEMSFASLLFIFGNIFMMLK